jgi:hypothetical protein
LEILKPSVSKTVELNAFPEAIPMQNQDGRNNRLSKISKELIAYTFLR